MAIKLEDYKYDAELCMRCGGCKWVDHVYMPGVQFGYKCPSIARYLFETYGNYGRQKIAMGLLNGTIQYSDRLVDVVYRCHMCGACDIGCKRNLDLEPFLVLESLRARLVEDGYGPRPEHKKIAENIASNHNRYGASDENRAAWITEDIKPATKADVFYFVGCASSYVDKEIAQATAQILQKANVKFMVLGAEEWCCGYPLYSTGQVGAFKKQLEHNLEALKKSGASTVLVSCAECYKTWKVDYPKLLDKSTDDMGFKVVHIVELVDQLIQEGKLKLPNRVDLKVTYHDPCNLGRLSEPWIHWEGKRVDWGCLEPPKEFRRGTYGVYEAPRNILRAIPGIELVEMIRNREHAWCCGAGGGVRDAYKDFALWTAGQRLEEVKAVGAEAIVSCCPYCKENFRENISEMNGKTEVYDITEIVLKAMA